MKIGDKVLCKKNYKRGQSSYLAGKFYTISSIAYVQGMFKIDCHWLSFDGYNDEFSLENVGNTYYNYFYEFFYNKQEMRKKKLEKLNII